METIINSSYLITIGTLIGYERKMKCKELAGTKEKEAYKQIPFCEGICCVQTYRNIEKATLEVKTPIYEKLLHKLGYEMIYDDDLYKEINYRLQNLNDAIEKYDLESVFIIVDKLNNLLKNSEKDIYQKYLIQVIDVIYQYYKINEFPDLINVEMMKSVYAGFPSYIKSVMIDILYKYAVLNIIDDNEYVKYVKEINLKTSKYVPNQINYLQFLCNIQDFDKFYLIFEEVLKDLKKKRLFLRMLDIYDLKIIADLNTDPTRIVKDIDECNINVDRVMNKLSFHEDEEVTSKTIKTKLSQHYYNIGYSLMIARQYNEAKDAFEKSLNYDDIFELACKVFLFNCYDRLGFDCVEYRNYINLSRTYDTSNKHYVLFLYYVFKLENNNLRERLKYIKKYVLNYILPEDTLLIRILFFEINNLAKATSNYQVLQEFIEKMGLIN
ncbi:hypothetical protein GSF08_06065 [Clostridiaceae bacterium DONG20-135]|uniref:Uncharacterized protein n=1 Tax=Copranaerobaculum intestinale TaxID=2692629 RepID=A0A6N8U5L5_9FIRM|nr:hypothetical protein [Copranaerobaculum intestinale]MXQ73496.1 hypothetical protein [Copranaerobaculum intestinale]